MPRPKREGEAVIRSTYFSDAEMLAEFDKIIKDKVSASAVLSQFVEAFVRAHRKSDRRDKVVVENVVVYL